MCPIAWDEAPASSSGPRVRVYNNTHPNAVIRPLEELFRVFVHWGQTCTVPCLAEECPHCRNGMLPRRIGYAAARIAPKGGDFSDGIWYIPERNLPDLAAPIAGLLYNVARNSAGASAAKPLRIEQFSNSPRVEVEPNFDARKILEAMWQPYILSVARANARTPVENPDPTGLGDEGQYVTEGGEILRYPHRNGKPLRRAKGGA